MKYTYSDTYLKYFRGIENTDILENILVNKQLIENPTEKPNLEKTRLLPPDTYHMDSNNIIQENSNYIPQIPSRNVPVNPDYTQKDILPQAVAVKVPSPSAPYYKDEFSDIII